MVLNVINVVVLASVRCYEDLARLKKVLEKHYYEVWLITDKKSVEIIARGNILSNLDSERVLVFAGTRVAEFVLKAYKVTNPDLVYICDESNVLKQVSDFFKMAPTKVLEC